MGFELKDSGQRQEFPTGARRDLQEGKGRPDLISTVFLQRLAVVMELGAGKYGDRNWEKGMPLSRYYSSALRHLMQAFEGRTDEDHLGQAAFNVMAFLHTQEMIKRGLLDPGLDDLPQLENQEACIEAWVTETRPEGFKTITEKIVDTPQQDAESDRILKEAGLTEGLDGVWRGKTKIDESVKNPGERQTPIYARPAVFDPPRPTDAELTAMEDKAYGETGELT